MSDIRRLIDLERRVAHLETLTRVRAGARETYTPTYTGATTPGVTTYTTQQGFYWVVGPLVFVLGLVVWTAATGTGTAQISLPFVPSASFGFRAPGVVRTSGVTFANGSIQAIVSASAALFTMESPLTNAAPTAVAVEAAGNVTFGVWYGVD